MIQQLLTSWVVWAVLAVGSPVTVIGGLAWMDKKFGEDITLGAVFLSSVVLMILGYSINVYLAHPELQR